MAPGPDQKTVLITGCSPGGIGHALALEFHAKGIYVIATARNPSVLAQLAAVGMSTLPLDVTKSDSIQACHADVSTLTGGKLDFLVNNAGRTHTHPAIDLDMDDVRETFETNVFGLMHMCAAFSDLLMAAKGLIINIASLAAVTPYVFGSAYCATKGAVVAYSRTLRAELRPFGVRVMVAMTGTVRSTIASKTHRTLPPTSVYQRVADLFERRLTFSQNSGKTMETDEYARKLVANALRSEAPLLLRAWCGRPDWFWAGGWATMVYAGTCLGEWMTDLIIYRIFGLAKLDKILQQEVAQKKLN